MPMATEAIPPAPPRRRLLGQLAALALLGGVGPGRAATPGHAAGRAGLRLAAAWERDGQPQIGWLQPDPATGALRVQAALDLPTRAHGLALLPEGSLVAVARRPGDWLLRWRPDRLARWHWLAPGQQFNGHVLASPDGRQLLCTQTAHEDGEGRIGLYRGADLAPLETLPSGGRDPHQLLWDPQQAGRRLMVAHGGLTQTPETGRRKLDRAGMDASLVALDLDPDRGPDRVQGRWRLDDPRLSLRHLAWSDGVLGIALQAEHDAPEDRARAPVLACFDGRQLRPAEAGLPLAGYGGDIVAAPGGGFLVACPRADAAVHFDADGRLRQRLALPAVCALARDPQGGLWLGGQPQARGADRTLALPEGLQLDNHWLVQGLSA